ncbi:hypothetical protein SAMN02799625_01929 [Methylobacterium sp. UNC300MFChir4.1]|uniref:hypothetical protein n=1 Tax=Methylobacterium sp. UNC300MFChir4.1 TaxID=1502747 RepID=UPI0008D03262|nr:hypothetical protein [Methylobacterium sp. UNC300MFChir4.1]SEN81442.1 hypothetical protein SAMN02799625_01929 [Methylobacterium sp. UNC300MFChir4.1]
MGSPAKPETAETLRLPPDRASWTVILGVLFGFVLFGGLLAASAVYTAPVLISDWQVREAARPVPNARVSDGKCSTKLVFHICDATLSLRTPAGSVTRRVNYVFTGLHAGDWTIGVMADPAHPESVTTDLGLDRLWNRAITLLAIDGVILAGLAGALISILRNGRAAFRTAA